MCESADTTFNDPIAKISLPPSSALRASRSQDLARQQSAVPIVVEQYLPVDDRVFDTLRLRHQSPSATGQVVANFRTRGRSYFVVVEDGEVGSHPRLEHSAPLDPEECRRLRRDALDRMLQRERALLADEGADQICR